MMEEKLIEAWRVVGADPFGLSCWFDPRVERLTLRGLTVAEKVATLDRVVSVSALDEDEDPNISNKIAGPVEGQFPLFLGG